MLFKKCFLKWKILKKMKYFMIVLMGICVILLIYFFVLNEKIKFENVFYN